MATAYELAASMAGSREGQAALTDFLRTGGQNIDPLTRAWCADFVNATLAQAGQKGTDSGRARSFMQWGMEVANPQKGDIAVFQRGGANSWKGHVGFFDSVNPDGTIKVLGGNQDDSVSYADFPAEKLLGYRRAAEGSGLLGPSPSSPAGGALAASQIQPMTPEAASGGMLAQQQGLPTEVAEYATSDDKSPMQKLGGILQAIGQSVPNAPAGHLGGGGDARGSGGLLSEYLSQPPLAQRFLRQRLS